MNRNVVGSIYGRPSIKIAHLGSVNKHGQHRQFLLLIGRFPKNFLSRLRIFFRNQPISNKNCLWWACLLTDWDEMSILYRGPSIIRVVDWSIHKKSSPLKPLGKMNRNLIGSSYGRPSVKNAHFVPIC
jgi:hypothetical protein